MAPPDVAILSVKLQLLIFPFFPSHRMAPPLSDFPFAKLMFVMVTLSAVIMKIRLSSNPFIVMPFPFSFKLRLKQRDIPIIPVINPAKPSFFPSFLYDFAPNTIAVIVYGLI